MTMNDVIVMVDNGHGRETCGKRSPDGRLKEWAWTRDVARRVVAELRDCGCDARLVTPEDADVSLKTRVARVNAVCKSAGKKQCVLVSLHVNASGGDGKWHDACGWSVYVSKNASDKSKKLARLMTERAMGMGLMGNRSVPKEKYWTWSWTKNDIYLLRETACPAVLTENGFMDNRDEVDFLTSDDGMAEMVLLHVESIIDYIGML